jgi:hypothetical protein
MAPGEHLSVLRRDVLETLLQAAGFAIVEEKHECVTLKAPDRWFAYGAKNHSSMAARAESRIIEDLLENPALHDSFRSYIRARNRGSELILVCRKL